MKLCSWYGCKSNGTPGHCYLAELAQALQHGSYRPLPVLYYKRPDELIVFVQI